MSSAAISILLSVERVHNHLRVTNPTQLYFVRQLKRVSVNLPRSKLLNLGTSPHIHHLEIDWGRCAESTDLDHYFLSSQQSLGQNSLVAEIWTFKSIIQNHVFEPPFDQKLRFFSWRVIQISAGSKFCLSTSRLAQNPVSF